jgi:tetratricopeptide (TPR) repeat protein
MTSRQLLAGELASAATTLTGVQPLTVEGLDVAILLLNEAAELTPSDPERWRQLFAAADLGERPDLRRRAIEHIVRLDPADDVARLRYVTEAIDNYQTVEERVSAYRKLLADPGRAALGPAVASRLANDLAWLLNRSGDLEGYAHWLGEAAALDPSNRNAVATAAGFFRMNVANDPFAEGELLTSLVLADPVSHEAQIVLASLLLEHGAYAGADRLYAMAARCARAAGAPVSSGLLADRALAQWGRGDADGALETIRLRQREVDEPYRDELRQSEPTLTPLELARRHAPVGGTLATVRAAVLRRLGSPSAAAALDDAVAAYEAEIEAIRRQAEADPAMGPSRCLDAASVVLWLGGDPARAESFLEAARAFPGAAPLDEPTRARFDGWLALRRGDAARAAAILDPIAESDPAARLGLALALRETGRPADAARSFYRLATARPGTAIGIWAGYALADDIGQRPPPSETARTLEALVASIPQMIDHLAEDPTVAVSMRLLVPQVAVGAYEPIVVNIEITNNAPFPIAIDRRGPIRPQVALIADVQMARDRQLKELPAIVVDLGRRLRLEPRQRLLVPVDLRRGSLAQALNQSPLRGASMKLKAISAFRMTGPQLLGPGPMGEQIESPPLRVDGVRLTAGWIPQSIARVLQPEVVQDVTLVALLSHVVFRIDQVLRSGRPEELDQFAAAMRGYPDPARIAADAAAAISEAYARLDPVSRAWLLGVMARCAPLSPVYESASKDQDRLVRMMYLLACLTSADDPALASALTSDDPVVRRVGELMTSLVAGAAAGP